MDTPHHLCTASSESSAPAFPSGREGGRGVFDAAGSQRCGGRQPGMAGYERPVSPVCRPSRIQRPGFSLRTGGRPGRFWHCRFWRYGQTARHGGLGTPRITHVPSNRNPAAPVFPSDGREAGALVLGCCSVSCGDIQPGRAACDILSGPAESKKTGSP